MKEILRLLKRHLKLSTLFKLCILFLCITLVKPNFNEVKVTEYKRTSSIYLRASDFRRPPSGFMDLVVEEVHPLPPLHFNPLDITQPSNISKEHLSIYINKCCPLWSGLEEDLLAIDKKLNILFLLSVAQTETSTGRFCVGNYNCFNIRQHNSYTYVNYFSFAESIEDFADLILRGYVAEDAVWYEEPWQDYSGTWHTSASIYTIGIHYATSAWAPYVENLAWEIHSFCNR